MCGLQLGQVGLNWHVMGMRQIWDFLRSVFFSFWLVKMININQLKLCVVRESIFLTDTFWDSDVNKRAFSCPMYQTIGRSLSSYTKYASHILE